MAELPVTQSTVAPGYLQAQLVARRRRLQALIPSEVNSQAEALLHEVDSALARLEQRSFGVCETCHDPIEDERLIADPLVRVCLGCLSETEVRALERDLETAAAVQGALLPAQRIDADGWQIAYRWRPLGAVSGDHCDVVPRRGPQSPLHFVLGDVSGKGVAASLLMANLQAIFRSLAPLDLPLADLVGRANHLLCEGTLASSFATLVVGRLWPSGTVELSNAGHTTPILFHRGRTVHVPPTGLPLGIFQDSRYEVRRFDLAPDDLLFLYTDGLTEALDDAGEAYGMERAERLLRDAPLEAPETALDRCLEDLRRFRGRAPATDDLTMMAVLRAA